MKKLLSVSVLLLALTTTPSFADKSGTVQPPVFNGDVVSVPGVGDFQYTTSLLDYEFEPEKGKWKLKGDLQFLGIMNGTANLIVEEIEFDPDPTVVYSLSWNNPTTVAQTYSFNMTIPALFNVSPNQIYGAITTQVIDGGMDGATVAAPAGRSIYNALIDGTVVRTMQSDVFSITAPPMGVGNGLETFGWVNNALPVNSSIGITLNFTLSPGDTAAFLARFDVIPEPTTLALLALGGLAFLRRRN